MHDDGVCPAIDSLFEEFPGGRYSGNNFPDLVASLDLKAVGTVIFRPLGFEQLIELGYQLQEIHKTDLIAANIEGK